MSGADGSDSIPTCRSEHDRELPLLMKLPQVHGTASPESDLGLLQRGRGSGWLRVADRPDGRALLLMCLGSDPRWDHQVESRSDYYATLALRLDLPMTALLAVAMAEDPDEAWIARSNLSGRFVQCAADGAGDPAVGRRDKGSGPRTTTRLRLPYPTARSKPSRLAEPKINCELSWSHPCGVDLQVVRREGDRLPCGITRRAVVKFNLHDRTTNLHHENSIVKELQDRPDDEV